MKACPAFAVALTATLALLAGCAEDSTTTLTIEHPDGTKETVDVPFDADDTPTAAMYEADGAVHPGSHTALDQLDRAGVAFNATYTEFGYFVQSVAGDEAGDEAYWKLVHNGQDAAVGAGLLVLAAGDSVLWTVEGFTTEPEPLEVQIAPAVRETTRGDVEVTVTTSHESLLHLTNGNRSVAAQQLDGEATFRVALSHGHNVLRATADDGTQTATAELVVVRLAEARVQVRFNGYPGLEDRDDPFWFDIHTFHSRPLYDDVDMEHPGNTTVHDAMAAWEVATGVPVDYRFTPSLGYSVTHIDGAGNPVDSAAPPWWCYQVNGQAPDLGVSSQPFVPGDVILWDLGDCDFVPA